MSVGSSEFAHINRPEWAAFAVSYVLMSVWIWVFVIYSLDDILFIIYLSHCMSFSSIGDFFSSTIKRSMPNSMSVHVAALKSKQRK